MSSTGTIGSYRAALATACCLGAALTQTAAADTAPATPAARTASAEPAASAPTLFIVHLTRGPAWNRDRPAGEQAGFREHSQNLNRMRADGVLVVGARYKDSTADKGMLLIRAANADAVQAQFATDPMVREKLFALDIAEFSPFYDGFVARLARAAAAPESPLNALAGLAGCWAGGSGKFAFREHWMRPAGGLMMGMGRTLVDGRIASYEAMRIELDADGTPAFVAKPSGQAEGRFRMVKNDAAGVVFENPLHDFPQRVRYQLKADGSLHARIEGVRDGKERGIDFPMRRASCE